LCKNDIVIIRNLEIKFHVENCYNYNNITFICILQSYIIFERGISFLTITKLFEFSGFQTKLVFKESFKYLKNEKINLSKVILKLECLFYQNIFIIFHRILYS